MRAIEFRCWDKVKKEMWYNQFCITAYGKIQKSEIAREWHSWKDEDWILLQFTGLVDKNGVKIFEGDLLINRGDKDAVFECFYHDGEGRFSIARAHYHGSRCGGFVPSICAPNLEVIGCIFTHPELLETEK